MTSDLTATPSILRLIIADDHAIFRDGLAMLLAGYPDIELVAGLENLTELRERVKQLQPDLLILDYHMPGGDTSAEISYLKQRYPLLKIIALTGSHSGLLLQQLQTAGADAVLLKDGSASTLRHVIDEIKAGRRYMAPDVVSKIADNQLELTPREFQILKLIYDGLSNNDIALQLNLSPKTTDKHRENMMRKLQVNNATQLLKKVIELGLLKSGSSQ